MLELQNIKTGLVQLTPREEYIIRAVFGIRSNKLQTPLAELAAELQLSVSHMRRIRSRALTKLRNSHGIELDDLKWIAELDSSLRGDFEFTFQDDPVIVQVTGDFQRLLDESAIRPEKLLQLTPRQFEEFIAELWERFGYQVELTKRTRDGGRDVIAVRRVEAELKFLIECKRNNPSHKVGIGLVRALYGVKMHEKATKAFLATTSYFTRTAKEFFEQHRWELEPRDYQGVLDWIKTVSQLKQTPGARLWIPSSELVGPTERDIPGVRLTIG
jgi:Restriction endonuclease/Sigma-70, region 4